MRTAIALCTILILVLIPSGCEKKIDTGQEQQKLFETEVAFAKMSVDSGAPQAFREFFADEATSLPARAEPVRGRQAIYEHMKEGGTDYVLNWEPKESEVASSGDLGYTWGTSTVTYQENGLKKRIHGKYTSVWRKQPDGSWKVIVDIGNQNPVPDTIIATTSGPS